MVSNCSVEMGAFRCVNTTKSSYVLLLRRSFGAHGDWDVAQALRSP